MQCQAARTSGAARGELQIGQRSQCRVVECSRKLSAEVADKLIRRECQRGLDLQACSGDDRMRTESGNEVTDFAIHRAARSGQGIKRGRHESRPERAQKRGDVGFACGQEHEDALSRNQATAQELRACCPGAVHKLSPREDYGCAGGILHEPQRDSVGGFASAARNSMENMICQAVRWRSPQRFARGNHVADRPAGAVGGKRDHQVPSQHGVSPL